MVATNTRLSRPMAALSRRISRINRSDRPSPYPAVVSTKLHPSSIARWSAAIESASDCGPQDPPMAHPPNPISEQSNPCRPNRRYFTSAANLRTVLCASKWRGHQRPRNYGRLIGRKQLQSGYRTNRRASFSGTGSLKDSRKNSCAFVINCEYFV